MTGQACPECAAELTPLEAAELAERLDSARFHELSALEQAARLACAAAEAAFDAAVRTGNRAAAVESADIVRELQISLDEATDAVLSHNLESTYRAGVADQERAAAAAAQLAAVTSAKQKADKDLKEAESLYQRSNWATTKRDERSSAARRKLDEHRASVSAKHATRVAAIRASA